MWYPVPKPMCVSMYVCTYILENQYDMYIILSMVFKWYAHMWA